MINTYKIIRFYAPRVNKPNKVMKRHLSLMEAQRWCNDPSTANADLYFDGYEKE